MSMLMSSYMIKSYIYNRLEGKQGLGMAASLKTTGSEKYTMKIAIER